MPDAIYRGYGGYHGVRVTVERGGAEYPLRHWIRHSPSGFSWGYGGSGPAELARCILLDHFYPDGRPERDEWNEPILPVSYQDFKFEVVAGWEWGERDHSEQVIWTLTGEEVEAWINQQAGVPRA